MGSKTDPPDTADAGAEFRDAVGPVRPLRRAPPSAAPAPARPATPRRKRPEAPPPLPAVLPVIEPGATVRLAQPGVSNRALRRLDGELFVAEAQLDLHGLTAVQAAAALQAFIADCLAAGCERVRIIHGKGQRPDQGLPVLKPLVIESLRGHPAVLALRSAGHRDGGSGAVRVLLRRA
ncbi:MAG: Smr/MutS family protein [Gammaproteobacteria bacterium]